MLQVTESVILPVGPLTLIAPAMWFASGLLARRIYSP